ncbi:CarD family transcriptional regulator [Acetobacteraceae bacterium]|nr:CarD family transcriptional regulator [Acetobacteraceae bacterium]
MNTNFKIPSKGIETESLAREAAENTLKQSDPKGKTKDIFRVGEAIVHSVHGVGHVDNIGEEEVAGVQIKMIQISFPGNHMILRIPFSKAGACGLRKIASREIVDKAIEAIGGKPQVSRGMWARRAIAYQDKINSGDLVQIAEVLRDLRRNVDSLDGSFSERKLFEAAQERFVAEVAILEKKKPEKVRKELIEKMKNL